MKKTIYQKNVAEFIGISDGYLCDILRGRRSISKQAAKKIKSAAKLSLDDIDDLTPREVYEKVREKMGNSTSSSSGEQRS